MAQAGDAGGGGRKGPYWRRQTHTTNPGERTNQEIQMINVIRHMHGLPPIHGGTPGVMPTGGGNFVNPATPPGSTVQPMPGVFPGGGGGGLPVQQGGGPMGGGGPGTPMGGGGLDVQPVGQGQAVQPIHANLPPEHLAQLLLQQHGGINQAYAALMGKRNVKRNPMLGPGANKAMASRQVIQNALLGQYMAAHAAQNPQPMTLGY